jgi:hypothetical protein
MVPMLQAMQRIHCEAVERTLGLAAWTPLLY